MNEIAAPNTKAFRISRRKESVSPLMSLGQSFVHAKADEMIEPGEEGLRFQNDRFSQEKAAASRWRERISL